MTDYALGTVTPDDIRELLESYESLYGVPSHRLVDAFTDNEGHLHETEDFHIWSSAYACLKVMRQTSP